MQCKLHFIYKILHYFVSIYFVSKILVRPDLIFY